LRIVAGVHGGRRLVAPKGSRTRPTADRVREALFSILFDVEGFAVLDLFAGSGAIGLEALSRGATRSVFVEKDRAALEALEANIASLQLSDRTEIRRQAVASALELLVERGDRFELVFADPPWDRAEELLADVLAQAPALLSEGGRLVLEHESRDASPTAPEGMIASDQRKYGDTALSFYRRSR
jgi:16S rRNA (guanine(966)-N(2))-methyltransferase RsmD